jgi:hypothetical protein
MRQAHLERLKLTAVEGVLDRQLAVLESEAANGVAALV